MHTTILDDRGRLSLDRAELRALGFEPGAFVDIVVASSGALILRVADTVPLDATYRPVVAGQARPALGAGRQRR